jgi:engulfment/cell motility protein 1
MLTIKNSVDLSIVSSVVSNVSASPPSSAHSSTSTLKQRLQSKPTKPPSSTSTKITIHGYLPNQTSDQEVVLLQLHPQTHTLASEWLDGLLMLLNQQPITADTNKLVNLISGYGLKIRLLNVRFDELGTGAEEPAMPDRDGLDEDYFYDIGGMEAGG